MVTSASNALCYRLCKSGSPPSRSAKYEDRRYIIPETRMSFWLYRNGSYDWTIKLIFKYHVKRCMSSNVMNRLLIASKHLSSQGTFFFIPLPVIVLYHVGPFVKSRRKELQYCTLLQMIPNCEWIPRPQMILDRKWSPKSTANDSERKIGMAWTHHVNFIIITKSQTKSEILLLK